MSPPGALKVKPSIVIWQASDGLRRGRTRPPPSAAAAKDARSRGVAAGWVRTSGSGGLERGAAGAGDVAAVCMCGDVTSAGVSDVTHLFSHRTERRCRLALEVQLPRRGAISDDLPS